MDLRIKVIVLISFLLAGCASSKNIPTNYKLSDESGKGILMASVTYRGGYSGYAIQYRALGKSKWSKLQIGTGTALLPPGMLDWDINKRKSRGNVFAIELPEGEYEFFSWSVSSGPAFISPLNPFSVRFNIEAGKATYAGNFHFIRESGLGATVTGVNVNLVNEFERDIELFKPKYTFLDNPFTINNAQEIMGVSRLGDGNSTTIFLVY